MIYLDVAKEIERKRRKLHESIKENGIDSEKTRKISVEIDNLLNEYYKKEKQYDEENTMLAFYRESLQELRNLTIDLGSFPTTQVWNNYAMKNNCLNNVSIEYISGLNWHKLRTRILSEIS